MNDLKAYVDSLIPANLPKSKKELLYDEIESHILDKADFYEEIGYPRKESIEMAIKDFGTDREVKDSIFGEFETLYYERTWWAIPAGIAVFAMNILAFWMDIWVGSADYNSDPDSGGAFASFCMIFFILGGIAFARIKRYRKTLIGIGVGSLFSVANFLICFFPQAAFFAISLNLLYLIDAYTPISMRYFFEYGLVTYYFASLILLFAIAMYCFITSYRIKTGKAKNIEKPKSKVFLFTVVFFAVAFASSILLPKAQRYEDDYPKWFTGYHSYISDETDYIYGTVNIGDSYDEVAQKLTEYGWISVESYEKTLDRLLKKQFKSDIKDFNFDENDQIWFLDGNRINGKYIGGNNFVALQKNESGIICKKAVGDVSKNIVNDNYFGYTGTNKDLNDDMKLVSAEFGSLKKGDSEKSVLSKFGVTFGEIYSKNTWQENGSVKTNYRIYCRGQKYYDIQSYVQYISCHIELTFTDGYLTEGKLYERDDDNHKKIHITSIKS